MAVAVIGHPFCECPYNRSLAIWRPFRKWLYSRLLEAAHVPGKARSRRLAEVNGGWSEQLVRKLRAAKF